MVVEMQGVRQQIAVDTGQLVYLHQAVRRDRDGMEGYFVVTAITGDRLVLADPAFENVPVHVGADEFSEQGFEPLYEGGVPVWGY